MLVSELTRFENMPGDGIQDLILFKSDPSTNVMLRLWRTKEDDPITVLVSSVVSWSVNAQGSPSALAKARPTGPPPTITTSLSTT